ncbi:MAG: GntP family permease [Prolixibacteraceae bacterium]|jgi:gluconate:H+ symporter, GntP family|nr:GntP family permease [Prolixibacteraceae bacterium]MBT6999458.1 GntP family permease [Prolixibacteraceae bacterium]MBT7394779.1 GntP family permease [Prolixibacteraceae bacterium]
MDPFILIAIGTLIVLGGILGLRLNAFLALFMAALIVSWLTPDSNIEKYAAAKNISAQETTQLIQQSAGERVANGFGSTCAKIGILIALASIIGKSMLDSGAADRIVRSAIRLLGEKRAPAAFLGSGFFLAIPVFYDTVFYLLLPLGKAMATRNERNYLLYILSIVAGTAMTHSLVPPTPGPLFVAGALNVDIGTMIMGGIVVGFFTVAAGYLYALWANRRWQIPLRETNDISLKELKLLSTKEDHELPSIWLSLLPILLPVVLIAGRTILNATVTISDLTFLKLLDNLGNSNTALAIAAAIAMGTLVYSKRNDKQKLSTSVGAALSSAGTIILITAAGGAFGAILQQTGVGPSIEGLANDYQIAILPLAFFVTLLVRTAQGSATVAMITAVGILSGFSDPATLGFHPVYLALVIGCGSKVIPWMNDSGFWIISKMSGFTERETLKTFSVMLTIMGFTGLIVVMVLAKFFPFV